MGHRKRCNGLQQQRRAPNDRQRRGERQNGDESIKYESTGPVLVIQIFFS